MSNYNENREYCKRIAEEIEKYASGDAYKCPHCGEVSALDAFKEIEDENGVTLYTCPNCGALAEEYDLEPLTLYDYFADALDIEYRIGSNRQFRSVCVMVTCGGPNIYIDTATKNVELYGWTEQAKYPLDYDAVDEINTMFEELYNC